MMKLTLFFLFLSYQFCWQVRAAPEVPEGPSFPGSGFKKVKPEGTEKTTKTKALEIGAKIIQKDSPSDQLDIYLVGLHPMKENPSHQMVAHHFCKQVNQDFAQRALFDGNSKEANLNGIEYIISEKLFRQLPEEEKTYWHPHNYEILSGTLVAPGLPERAERELMKEKMNSYGKTWHVWNTGHFGLQDGHHLPLGDPMLAWSFNHDGEAKAGLIESMEKKLDLNVYEKRKARADLVKLAKPQVGVNVISNLFKRPLQSLPGVQVAKETETTKKNK